MTPLKSIRKFCVQCVGSKKDVRNCGGHKLFDQGDENNQCWLYPYRMGKGRPSVKAIRRHCLECMGGSYQVVANCNTFDCPAYIFRFGKNPNKFSKTIQRTEEISAETAS